MLTARQPRRTNTVTYTRTRAAAFATQVEGMKAAGRTVLAVLALWHALAAIQNVFDILASTGLAPGLRRLASKNLELIGKLAEPLHLPKSSLVLLLAGAATVEAAASASFACGAIDGDRNELGFGLSLALFGSFFLIDDAFDDYDLGAKHRAIFTLVAAGYAASKAAQT